jgi:chemotaxis protein MotB
MARKAKHEEHENHERWLVSYADFITLLCAFFVVMYASNQSDPQKAKAVEAGIEEAFAGPLPQLLRDWLHLENGGGMLDNHPLAEAVVADLDAEAIKVTLDGSLTDHTVQIGFVEQDLTLVPPARHHFQPGSAELHPSAFAYLASMAEALQGTEGQIEVIGHADAVPVSGSAWLDNWDLAGARAVAAVRYLVGRGVDPSRLTASASVTTGIDPNARAFTVALKFENGTDAAAATAAIEAAGLMAP